MSGFTPDDLENAILDLWKRENTFAVSLQKRASAPTFSFYDGPPYATGYPHYGHILQTTVKDTVTRYWTMRGSLVDRRVGWDCHGLPVENMVEAELGTKTKRGIEAYGIEKFNAKCRSTVLSRVDEFTKLLGRLGRWADYDKAYKTMDTSFMESAWWVFKTAWDRGLVYRGLRSSPYCPRCETPLSNFEKAQGYEKKEDPSLVVKVPLLHEQDTYILIWTTTPWTLPANVAIAVHPEMRYAKVRVGGEFWILAEDRIEKFVGTSADIVQTWTGEEFAQGDNRGYVPLYGLLPLDGSAYTIVTASFVNAVEGTGAVHVAPAFGEEDFALAQEKSFAHIPRTVDASGRLTKETQWLGVPLNEANVKIIENLRERKLLVRDEKLLHDYPHCWRCSTPLIYMAVDSWFIAVTKIKEQLLKNAEQIRWVPAHLKEGRFGQGLRDAPDWAISRTRYWGIPLPAWQCAACGEYTVVGSVRELEQLGGDLAALKSPHANPDLHRPYVDRIVLTCAHCKRKEARRVPEVLDVWFDSGSMPYGQWHYPFENKEIVESTFPADFIGEALDQTRGWFYTLHVLAGILTLEGQEDVGLGTGKPAYKNVVVSGLVLAEDGRKLSKRFGNYPEPDGIVSKYGADTLRLYLLSSAKTGEDYRFSDQLVGDLYRRFTLILWNVWQYYRTYGAGNPKSEAQNPRQLGDSNLSLLDRWILARTAQLASDVQNAMDAYQLDDASRALLPFVDDLSTWYVRRSRGREEALPVLREVLRSFSLVASPFIPFLAEHIHRELTGTSPHLEDWLSDQLPKLSKPSSNVDILDQMRVIRELVSAGQRARVEAKVKVRQPLAEAVIVGDVPLLAAAGEEGLALVRDELNVKHVRIADTQRPAPDTLAWVWCEVPGGKIGLHTEISETLKQEGIVRNLIRHVQDLRKQAGYAVTDAITLSVVTDDAIVREALQRFHDLLRAEIKGREILATREGKWDQAHEVSVGGSEAWVAVRRA